MSNDNVLTKEGHAKLTKDLEELKTVSRRAIADAIREAKAHGDLKENAAYHEAKLNQSRLEMRISELEGVLMRAKILDPSTADPNKTFLGSKVTLLDLDFDEEFTIELVGAFETDASHNKISIVSPLGKEAFLKTVGTELEVNSPSGVLRYKILNFTN